MRVQTLIEFKNGIYTELKKEFDFSFIMEIDVHELIFIYNNKYTFKEVVYKYIKLNDYKMCESWDITDTIGNDNRTKYKVWYWTDNKPMKWTFKVGTDSVAFTNGNKIKGHIENLVLSN